MICICSDLHAENENDNENENVDGMPMEESYSFPRKGICVHDCENFLELAASFMHTFHSINSNGVFAGVSLISLTTVLTTDY